jgi:hypothetical protein
MHDSSTCRLDATKLEWGFGWIIAGAGLCGVEKQVNN